MEIQFANVSSAHAGRLAEELELALVQAGVPANALSIKRSSPQAMDPGNVLWASVQTAAHALGAVGYIACFAKCIFEVVKRHEAPSVVIATKKGSVTLPFSELSIDLIKKAIEGNVDLPKAKKKAKGRPSPKRKAARA